MVFKPSAKGCETLTSYNEISKSECPPKKSNRPPYTTKPTIRAIHFNKIHVLVSDFGVVFFLTRIEITIIKCHYHCMVRCSVAMMALCPLNNCRKF